MIRALVLAHLFSIHSARTLAADGAGDRVLQEASNFTPTWALPINADAQHGTTI
jgi:hypothetical protein